METLARQLRTSSTQNSQPDSIVNRMVSGPTTPQLNSVSCLTLVSPPHELYSRVEDSDIGPDTENTSRPRRIERGKLRSPGLSTFWVQSEGFPLWLLSLDWSFVQQVHLVGGSNAGTYLSNMRSRGFDLSLLNSSMDCAISLRDLAQWTGGGILC